MSATRERRNFLDLQQFKGTRGKEMTVWSEINDPETRWEEEHLCDFSQTLDGFEII